MAVPLVHLVPLGIDLGCTPQTAAGLLLALMISGVFGRLFFGWLADRVGGLLAYFLASLAQTSVVFWFTQTGDIATLFQLSVLFGFGFAGVMTCLLICAREAAPLRLAGSSVAIVSTAGWIGMGLGSYQAGYFYDISASYLLSYANAAIGGILNLLIVAALFWYRHHRMVRRARGAFVPGASGPSRFPDALRGLPEQFFALGRELHRGEKILDPIARQRLVNRGEVGARLVEPVGERQGIGGDRQDMRVRVRAGGGLDGPVGRFVELLEPHQRHRARAEHAEEQRIERAQVTRVVGGLDGGARIAALRLDESQRVVAEREVRAELDRLLQLDDGLVLAAAQPERPAHGPVRGRVAIVDHEALPGGVEGAVDFRLALGPALEGVLEVREGQAGIGAREGRDRGAPPSRRNAGPARCRRG